jgi:D-glycero-alpha-D-manno-heptose-7-phosphate kinase
MIISRAPLRVSFFGGGTDFPEYFREHGGAVLATAIDKFSYVTVSAFQSHLFDYAVRVSYSKGELVKNLDEIQHPVFRECLRYCGFAKDIEIHTVADLPAFTGLGSSSSFTVSMLQALHAYKGEFIRPLELAYEAIHIERNVLKECVGVQDQATAAIGGFNVLEFHAEDDIRVHSLSLSPGRIQEIEAHLFMVFTGVKRRAHNLEAKKIQNFSANGDHLREMRRMVDDGHDLLVSAKPLAEFGSLLHNAWMAKRRLDGCVSTPEIDMLYEIGIAAGAWGGKLLGAGGGGFILFIAPPECHGKLKKVFSEKHTMNIRINAPGSQVVFAS